jgi:hypothetical protein
MLEGGVEKKGKKDRKDEADGQCGRNTKEGRGYTKNKREWKTERGRWGGIMLTESFKFIKRWSPEKLRG